MDPHRLTEQRSMELHRLVAARCKVEPALFDRARAVFDRWCAARVLPEAVEREWRQLFSGDRDKVLAAITSDDEEGRTLRSSSPFSVLVTPRERWAMTKKLAS